MGLSAGTRLGPYHIVTPIGAGGIDEVDRARDTRLNRGVAIKVLPGDGAANPRAVARLEHGALPVRKAVDLAVQIAEGLAAVHEKGIDHRDLKPEKVFVTSDGRVKLRAILEHIADAEGVEADARNVEARIEKVALENALRPEETRRKLDNEDGAGPLRSLLLAEQTLDYLIEGSTKRPCPARRRRSELRGRRTLGRCNETQHGGIQKPPDRNRRRS